MNCSLRSIMSSSEVYFASIFFRQRLLACIFFQAVGCVLLFVVMSVCFDLAMRKILAFSFEFHIVFSGPKYSMSIANLNFFLFKRYTSFQFQFFFLAMLSMCERSGVGFI